MLFWRTSTSWWQSQPLSLGLPDPITILVTFYVQVREIVHTESAAYSYSGAGILCLYKERIMIKNGGKHIKVYLKY